ncbi:MAG: iron-containing alcohol dehydrogenase, partial [Oscillospiraceae bacterium]|nr:iron-containing alcohol dehydrogenase [Oscillospiraceae bacterium]
FCRENGIDFILAVGGGSVMDSAKAISLGMAYDGDPWDIFATKNAPEKRIPIGAVTTIAAAGSEMSGSCVITNPELNLKRSFNGQVNRPEVAFLNPENTFTVSPYQTACGIVDIMMHTLERYFTGNEDTEPTDSFAEGLIRATREAGIAALKNPCDYEARATLMWCSALSHNDITGCGRTRWFNCHDMEHDISGVYDTVSHGAGLAVVWPAWAKFEYKNDVKRFARFAKNVWNIEKDTDEESALAGIEAMKAFFHEIGMPTTMAELGVSPDSYDKIANLSTNNGTHCVPSYTPLDKKNILAIYKLAE